MTENHSRIVRQLENRVTALDYENKDMNEKRHKSESIVQRQNEQIRSLKEEIARFKNELDTKGAEHTKINTNFHDIERNYRIVSLENSQSSLLYKLYNAANIAFSCRIRLHC